MRRTAPTLTATLRDVAWRNYLLGMVGAAIFMLLLAKLISDTELRQQFKFLLLIALICVFAAKEAAELPQTLAVFRQRLKRTNSLWRSIVFLLPAEIAGWLLTVVRLQVLSVAGPHKFESTHNAQHLEFSFLKRSAYTTLLPTAIFCSIVELPIIHLLLPHLIGRPEGIAGLHTLLILFSVITTTSLIGDRRALDAGMHRISDRHLSLELGVRCRGSVSVASILEASLLTPLEARKLRTSRKLMIVSPWDAPNILIRFKSNHSEQLEYMGSRVAKFETLALYVDQPGKLRDAINSASCYSDA